MLDLTFTCAKCKQLFCTKTIDIKQPLVIQKEYWFTQGPDICDECKENKKMEIRDKKINQILKRRWFDIFKR
jgi:hypothetical protein